MPLLVRRHAWLLLALGVACGPSASTSVEAPTGEPSAARGAVGEPQGASDEEPGALHCGEECFPCGDGFCPAGWVCDEGAVAGPSCAWLAECAGEATCECARRVLGACDCRTESGGTRLRCGAT